MKSFLYGCLAGAFAVLTIFGAISRFREFRAENTWKPFDPMLEDARTHGLTQDEKELAATVQSFYILLHDKVWDNSYEFRTAAFKKDVAKELYVRQRSEMDNEWRLISYRVLAFEMFRDPKRGPKARLVMEFIEAPGPQTSVKVVWWKKEGDNWRCEEEGPPRLPFSRRNSLLDE